MKTSILCFKISCGFLICLVSLLACNSNDANMNPTPTSETAMLDRLASHFKFLDANVIEGKIPAPPTGSSIKFSIKDTLRLVRGALTPIKFLHDTTSNVTGVYIQVVAEQGGTIGATSYFDIPEMPDQDDDTVSIVIVGFDPTTLDPLVYEPPFSFNIVIEPHDEAGQPLDGGTIPVEIEKPSADPNSVTCGLTDGYWDWDYSIIQNDPETPGFKFNNNPDKIWGRTGQVIQGSCCAGTSVYGVCPGQKEPNAALHFSTYSQYVDETLTFYENNHYFRETSQNYATPDPEASDFCADNGGVVDNKITNVTYEGNMVFTKIAVPERLWYPGIDSENGVLLTLDQTSSSNFGYGNPGGLVYAVTCDILVLIQLDPEGFGDDLIKYYERKSNYQSNDEDDWYDIPEN